MYCLKANKKIYQATELLNTLSKTKGIDTFYFNLIIVNINTPYIYHIYVIVKY